MKKTYLTKNNIEKYAKMILNIKIAKDIEQAKEYSINAIIWANAWGCSVESYISDLEFNKTCKEMNI